MKLGIICVHMVDFCMLIHAVTNIDVLNYLILSFIMVTMGYDDNSTLYCLPLVHWMMMTWSDQ